MPRKREEYFLKQADLSGQVFMSEPRETKSFSLPCMRTGSYTLRDDTRNEARANPVIERAKELERGRRFSVERRFDSGAEFLI